MKGNFASVIVGALLAGCAGMVPIDEKMSMNDVKARWGEPTQVHTLSEGARMIFSTGPMGQSVYVVDVNKAGQVTRVRDVMNRDAFAQIKAGMAKWEVERELGPAFWYARYRVSPNLTGIYKFQDIARNSCFYVEYDRSERVVSTATADQKRGRDLFPGEHEC